MPRLPPSLCLLLALAGCRGAGPPAPAPAERPPAPLDSMSVASDARIDSLGYLAGSFVGEGTPRAIHLLSSDTGFIARLVRRYRPALDARGALWDSLGRRGTIALGAGGPRRTTGGAPRVRDALVGSPLGHTAVSVSAVLVRGGRCGARGAQAEFVVTDDRDADDPPLRGPVLGSIRAGGSPELRVRGLVRREEVPAAPAELVEALVTRTSGAIDTLLAAALPRLRLRRPSGLQVEINTLADVDAADVVAYRAAPGLVRYAVSLRERRITAGRDTLLVATVMGWDRTGRWHQVIFRPTLLALRRGRPAPYGALRRSLFWRRLQPISDFGFTRDNLWMEQVDARDGSVLWGIVQPRGNVVVAAAEVEGPCR